jgi:formylglycine-generating enzyme required for sulfatase activity
VRLPTEAEWEFAARGSQSRKFPWGDNESTPEHANYGELINRTTAVGAYPMGVTPEGIFDLAGNIWEWCLDWYNDKYYAECKKRGMARDPGGPKSGEYRVLRGGAYWSDVNDLRAARRYRYDPDLWNDFGGFRVVWSAESRSPAEFRHANAARSRTGGWRRNMTRPPPAGPLEK